MECDAKPVGRQEAFDDGWNGGVGWHSCARRRCCHPFGHLLGGRSSPGSEPPLGAPVGKFTKCEVKDGT